MAIKEAIELLVSWGYNRPNGTDCFAIGDGYFYTTDCHLSSNAQKALSPQQKAEVYGLCDCD